jgi:dTDP-4-amino-4,6-dideoxygalactose transaminase
VKFNHVAHHALTHKRELLRAVEKVLTSGIFLEGPAVKKLQQQLSSFLGGGYVTTVTSGHDALVIALASLQLQAGDEVNRASQRLPQRLSGGSSGTQTHLCGQ